MNTATSSRRAILGGGTAIIATALLTGGNGAHAQTSTMANERLRRAMALHDQVDAECARFDVEVEMPARQACGAAIDAYRGEAPPPHEQSTTTFTNIYGDIVRLSTATPGVGAVARKVVSEPSWADMGDEDWRQAHRELAEAHERRETVLAAQAKRKAEFEAATRARFRIAELSKRSATLAERRYRLWNMAVAVPVASLADVVTKLDFITRTVIDDELGEHEFSSIAADVRRIAGNA